MSSNSSIVDRVVERLKAQPLGDLITEDDLFEIVAQAIPKVFFEERVVPDGYHSSKKLPPLIYEAMREVLEKHMKAAVDKWAEENRDKLLEFWTKASEEGILKTAQRLQDERATSLVRTALQPLFDAHNREADARGLPRIYL